MARNGFDVTLADRRKPWDVTSWSEGQKPTSSYFATSAEMLEAAGLANLNVTKRPMWTLDHDGQPVALPGRYANVDAKGQVRGINLTDRYVNIQMEDAFGFGDAIVDSGEAAWERAGSAKNGSLVFGCMELTHLGVKVPGDDQGGDMVPYLLILNSFGGEAPLGGLIAFIRPVCTNTFEAAKGTKTPYRFSIRHTGTLDGKLQMAREALGITFQHVAEVQALTTHLATTKLVESQVQAILDATFADPDHKDQRSPLAIKVWDHYQASPTLDGIRGTGWGVFNAVSEYLDHVQDYRPRGAAGDPLALRAENLLVGKAQGKKEVALKALLAIK